MKVSSFVYWRDTKLGIEPQILEVTNLSQNYI